MSTTSTKAGLIAALKEAKIGVSKNLTVTELKHRIRYWRPGHGFLLRLIKKPSRKATQPVALLEWGHTYWVPNSRMAKDIIKSQIVFVMGRTPKPPKDATFLDVPTDYNDRWPLGGEYGSDDNTDS